MDQSVRFLIAMTAALALSSAAVAQTPTPSTAVRGFVVDQAGNLGVGTNTPRSTLHVAGDSLTDGTIKGGGLNGQFGSAAVLSGFDTRYGQRQFVLVYDGADTSPTHIQIHAINPVDPNQSTFKTFIIANPRDTERYLVHASLEGPEGAVYYRGAAQLVRGKARVVLPSYFESLTREDGRTIQLTNVDGFDVLAVQSQHGARVRDGAFVVTSRNPRSNQRFDWEVKAVRADGPPLVVEPLKSTISVGGVGPYTYQTSGAGPADPLGGQ